MNPGGPRASAQSVGERLCRLVGKIEGVARDEAQTFEIQASIRPWRGARVRMHVDTDPLQQLCVLERAAPAQHRMAHDRVVLAEESGRECLCEHLFLDESERAEAASGYKLIFADTQPETQVCEQVVFARRRERVAYQIPCLPHVSRFRLSLHERQCLGTVYPAAECLASEHEPGIRVEHPQ